MTGWLALLDCRTHLPDELVFQPDQLWWGNRGLPDESMLQAVRNFAGPCYLCRAEDNMGMRNTRAGFHLRPWASPLGDHKRMLDLLLALHASASLLSLIHEKAHQ